MGEVVEHVQFRRPGTRDERAVLEEIALDMGYADPEYIAEAIMRRLERFGFAIVPRTKKD